MPESSRKDRKLKFRSTLLARLEYPKVHLQDSASAKLDCSTVGSFAVHCLSHRRKPHEYFLRLKII